ncbi:MAG TPA: MerR family transcriptional regulator [Thermoanaerobaculia bacterium]|jgi:DNA-binding transcriptional MerR regulator|nr:MerR family transcriptional regulator [Thermoanaerobaculia bacterium]
MVGKVKVQKRLYYKIGEACKALGIQPYVLRYWETEFPALAPSKSRSGQRVYSQKELEIIRRIKELLYDEGYTIAGAKKKLETELANGSLGEGDDESAVVQAGPEEEPEAPEAPAAVPAPSPAAPRRTRPQAVKPPAAPAVVAAASVEAPESPASDAEERLLNLRSAVAKALSEARDLLALLDAKAP